jgi:hypothetical protein
MALRKVIWLVFEGKGVGKLWNRSAGWFRRVVGRDGDGNTYFVRNRILSAKGSSARVDGEYMTLQTDFTLARGSEERVHFRTLSKRTRERVVASADEHNNARRELAEKELIRVKKLKTLEKESYLLRREQKEQQGVALIIETKAVFDEQLQYWQKKCELLEQQKKSSNEQTKKTSKTKEVLHSLVLSVRVLSFHVYSFLFRLLYFVVLFGRGSIITSAIFFLHIKKERTRCHHDALLITLKEAHANKEVLSFLDLILFLKCCDSAKPWPFYFLGSCLVLGLVLSWVMSCLEPCLVLGIVLLWVMSCL